MIGRVGAAAARAAARWVVGAAALSAAKILENMEIGHNVMHGQWDWMNDPRIHSSTWDWDTASTAEAWKHSHNYVHHTFTNIRGKDKDLGYEIMRIDPHQKWHPVYLLQPLYNVAADGACSSGAWRCTTSTSTRSARARSRCAQVTHELKGIAGKARARSSRTTSPGRWSARWRATAVERRAGARGATRARARRLGRDARPGGTRGGAPRGGDRLRAQLAARRQAVSRSRAR